LPTYEAWSRERAAEIIGRRKEEEGAALPILHELQEAFGCVPEAAVPMLAQALNLSRAEVHGVVTFYGRVTLEATYCLGLCALAPSAMLDGHVVGRLDEKRLDALLTEVDA
jgi:formate dehydrogenase subunit gamma